MNSSLFKTRSIFYIHITFFVVISIVFAILIKLVSSEQTLQLNTYAPTDPAHIAFERLFAEARGYPTYVSNDELRIRFDIFYSKVAVLSVASEINNMYLKDETYRELIKTLMADIDLCDQYLQKINDPLNKTEFLIKMTSMRDVITDLGNKLYEIQVTQYQENYDRLSGYKAMIFVAYTIFAIFACGLFFIEMRHRKCRET